MGYFSSGSEGSDFESRFCEKCVHRGHSKEGYVECPVWDAHLLFAYEYCNKDKEPAKVILDSLIERKDLDNRCVMFIEGNPPSPPKKLKTGRRVSKRQLPLVGE